MKKLAIIALIASAFLTACNNNTVDQADDKKAVIYTTVYPLQYFTEQIGGDYVEAASIYPPGADEHTYEPSQKDMIDLAEADLLFYVGLGLEGFVEKAKGTLKNEKVEMIAAGEHVEFGEVEHETDHEHNEANHDHESEHEDAEANHDHDGHDHNHGDIDPHVWLDPIYAKALASSIKTALTEKMPEQANVFEENYNQLAAKLDELNDRFAKTIETAEKKEILVSHAAFGYWELRYGIKQISVAGLSTSNEPSQKQLQAIVEEAKEHDLHYIFFEQNVSSKLTEIVQKEINAEALTLHNLAVLTEEDMKNKDTYFTLMNRNIENIEKALNH